MAEIYLEHPRHGDKVACSDQEAKHDRENGWKDFDPKERQAAATVKDVGGLPAFLTSAGNSDLPLDFPGRQALIDGGLPFWATLVGKTAEELDAIKGIGPATAADILKALDV